MNFRIVSYVIVALLFATFTGAFADYTKDEKPSWMKYATPGEGHKIFKDLTGNWKHNIKWWMKPGDKPEEHSGTNTNKLILGGRFLQQDAKGKAMGQPFIGLGITGFDALKEKYQSVWMDNMGTAMMTATGTYDAEKKMIKEEGTFSDAMTQEKERWYRAEWNLVDKNNYTYSMYVRGVDGTEFKSMEITYTRKK